MEFPPDPGGIGSQAYNLAKEFSILGFNVHVICPTSPDQDTSHFDRQQGFNTSRLKDSSSLLKYPARIIRVLRLTIKNRPNIIIASGRRGAFYSLLPQLLLKIPRISIGHGSEFVSPSKSKMMLTNLLYKSSMHCIAVSNYTKKMMIQCGLPHNRVTVIPNGANPSEFSPSYHQQPSPLLNTLKNKTIILTVGRLSLRKGQDIVIKALANLIHEFPNTCYVMVGPDKEKAFFEKIISKLNLKKSVFITGNVTREQLITFYKQADIYILNSRLLSSGENEGFGISIIEAALAQTPAIGTKGCGIEDAIKNNSTGILIPMDSVSETTLALKKLLDSSKLRKQMGQQAHQLALEKFTWERIANKYKKIINNKMTTKGVLHAPHHQSI